MIHCVTCLWFVLFHTLQLHSRVGYKEKGPESRKGGHPVVENIHENLPPKPNNKKELQHYTYKGI